MTAQKGTLYLIPVTLGEGETEKVLPSSVRQTILKLGAFIVENEKTARRFIKKICPEKKQSELILFPLNKHVESSEFYSYIQPLLEGTDVGIMSEAGCPGIADPGAVIVDLAHQHHLKVVPLVGPSSILLSLMASGLNGQSFTFHGYLPIDKHDKKKHLKHLERISSEHKQAQLFIETPYRNNQLLDDMLHTLSPNTKLCVACDITLDSEFIRTQTIAQWKKSKVDLHKRPCIFIIQKE